MAFNGYIKRRLLCPGPTPVPLESHWNCLGDDQYHRHSEFYSVFLKVRDLLNTFLNSDKAPLLLTSSGTGAMEAAVVNLTEEGDSILVIEAGRFAERWLAIAKSYRCKVESYQVPWGGVPDIDVLRDKIAKKNYKAVFFQGVETSTGVYLPVEHLAEVIRQNSKALIVVDAISSLVAHEMRMADWGIDCVIGGSQKGFGAAPGLSFIALSDRAINSFSKRGCFYFDLRKELASQRDGFSSWTPNIQLVLTLNNSLAKLLSRGYHTLLDFHRSTAMTVRTSLQASGLELFVSNNYAFSVTPFFIPKPLKPEEVKKRLFEKFNIIVAGGQDKLKSEILRIAHMGFIDPFDLLSVLSALEISLNELGAEVQLGRAAAAFTVNFPHSA
jgi:serine---pyruvate transaminase